MECLICPHSALYSPVLGPALRRAVGRHQMDLVLDGEVIAWVSLAKIRTSARDEKFAFCGPFLMVSTG